MRREDKNKAIENLTDLINNASNFYLTDIGNLNAGDTSKLRRTCFRNNVQLLVVKNTLLKKALERSSRKIDNLDSVLAYHTSIMFSEQAGTPAKLIKEFRKKENQKKPLLKAAYVQECLYIGDNNLEALCNIKTKEEVIGEIIGLLQSPMSNVISALQSGSHIIAGVVKTLSEKKEE